VKEPSLLMLLIGDDIAAEPSWALAGAITRKADMDRYAGEDLPSLDAAGSVCRCT
jgi:hypothetical protein